jgi:hypothetical protein
MVRCTSNSFPCSSIISRVSSMLFTSRAIPDGLLVVVPITDFDVDSPSNFIAAC